MPDSRHHLNTDEIESRLSVDASTGSRTIATAAGAAGLGSVLGPEGAVAGAILGAGVILLLAIAQAARHLGQ
jgi:hypothetical protein